MLIGNAEGDLAIGPVLFPMSQVSNQVNVSDRGRLLSNLLSLPGASTTMIAAAGLLCIGAVMVLSAQSGLELKSNLANPMLINLGTLKQMAYVAIALGAMVAVSRVDYRWFSQPWWLGVRPVTWMLLVSTVLVGLTLVPHIGMELNGRKRWLSLGMGISFQPSELAKLALVLWLAERFGTGRKSVRKFWFGLLPAGVVMVVLCGLVAKEDFGTAALMGLVSLSLVTAAGMHVFYLVVLMGGAAAGVYALIVFEPYRMERLKAHKDIWADAMGKGYQACQSLLAIAGGGWMGVGFGAGLQKFGYLPEAQSDFIFATICEEMGFLGAVVVIVLFAVIVWQGACIVASCRDDFGKLAGLGIALTIGLQAAMNIAVVTVMVPTKGISLPLVSAGGTSLIVTAASVGLLASIAKRAAADVSNTGN
jgi:cell division protein FtsW